MNSSVLFAVGLINSSVQFQNNFANGSPIITIEGLKRKKQEEKEEN
jgi:hypothetical protein